MTLTRVTDAELREIFEKGLMGGTLGTVERHQFDKVTSYPFQLLILHLASGQRLQVVVKDFGSTRLPKDDLSARAEREASVYRDLLAGVEGTARLYGIIHNPIRLVLEHVVGAELRSLGLDAWIDTASWLGSFQRRMSERSSSVRGCNSLLRHNRAFFLDRAHAARTAMTRFGSSFTSRLETLLDGYEGLVDVMVDQDQTLVHGSFRPQNILVSSAPHDAKRVCPVDWELAGLGSPLYDLAFLAEGMEGAKLDGLLNAYLKGAESNHSVPGKDMTRAINCFRLHKVIKSLGDSVMLGFHPPTVTKLLTMGAALRDRLG